ncbi:MAG: DUF2341 domain-containing protein [Verrucomicrobia bacterium]|nr:DUF2341 domain-containing protein [Verrucomicrobiota bacterium]
MNSRSIQRLRVHRARHVGRSGRAPYWLALAACCWPLFEATAANRYWVATSAGDWNSAANWSTTSGGSGGASVPGSGDDVFFTSARNGNCTLNAGVNVASMNLGGYTGTIAQASGISVTVGSGGWTQSSGTFIGGNSAIDNNGSFTLSGGGFTATTGAFYQAGHWTHSGGTFNHNGGTVVFDGGSSTADVPTTEIFQHLTVNLGSGSNVLSVPAADTLRVLGTLTFNNGQVNNGTFEAQGHVVVGSSWDGGNALLLFGGAANQNFDLSGATSYWRGNVTIQKPGGTVTMLSDLYLNSYNNQGLTLTGGSLNLNSRTVEVYYSSSPNNFLTVNGNFTVAGSGQLRAYHYLQTAGTMTFTGAATLQTYAHFTLNGAGATFTPNNATVDIDGNLTLSNGTLDAPATTLYVAGHWLHTAGGTFNPNNGTVVFDGGTATADVMTTEVFHHLTVNLNSSSAVLSIASGDTLRVLGTLVFSNGQAQTGTLEAQGNVVVGSSWDGGNALLLFCGSLDQTFNLSSATSYWRGNVTINKPAGQVTLLSDLYLNSSSNQALTLTAGTLDLSGRTVEVYFASAPNNALTVNGAFTVAGAGHLRAYNYVQNAASTMSFSGTATLRAFNDFMLQTSANGVFTANNATVDIDRDLILAAGTFNAPAGTLWVGRHWTHPTSGTFNHNNGTVVFDGGSATADVIATEIFHHLNVNLNSSSAVLTIAAGDTLRVLGTLTLSNGQVQTGTLEARGHVAVGSSWDGGNALLLFAGTANQDFDLTNATSYWRGNIAIQKAGGTVTMLSDLYLNSFSTQALTLTSGTLHLNGRVVEVWTSSAPANTLTVNGTFTVTGTGQLRAYNFVQNAAGTFSFSSTPTLRIYNSFTLGASGAVFNASGATVDIDGSVSLANGTFNAPTGTLSVGGAWSRTGATFNAGSGTVVFDGAGSFVEVPTTETFQHLTVNLSSSSHVLSVALNDTLRVLGHLSLVNGTAAQNASGATFEAHGNVVVGSSWDGGNLPLRFAGGNAQSFDLTSATSSFRGHVIVNKSAGAVTMLSDLYLAHSGQTLTLTAGTLDLSGRVVEVYFSGGGTGSLVANGTFTVAGAGQLRCMHYSQTAAGTFSFSGGATLRTYGDFTLNASGATFTANSATVDIDGALTLSAGTFNAPAGTLFVGRNWTRTGGIFNHHNGTVTLDGYSMTADVPGLETFNHLTVSLNGSQTLTVASGDTLRALGTLNLVDGAAAQGGANAKFEAQGNVVIGPSWDGGNLPLVFSGSADATFNTAAYFQGTVTVSKTGGAVRLVSSLALFLSNQHLTVTSGTFDLNGHALTVNGTWANLTVQSGGNLQLQGGESLTLNGAPVLNAGSTVTYTGSSGTVALKDYPYQNLTLAGAATFNPPGNNLTLGGHFTQTSGTFNAPSGTLGVGGHFIRTGGVFNPNAGTVLLNGGSQSLTGATTFHHLTKTAAASATLTFPAGATQTVQGTLTLQGAGGQLLLLRSSNPGTRWQVSPGANRAVSFVNVQDGHNLHPQLIAPAYSVDAGNNLGWFAGPISATDSTVVASPLTVPANGFSVSRATVTLRDTSGFYAAGQTVALGQDTGNSLITPTTAVTDADGVARFLVSNTTAETTTYTASVTPSTLPPTPPTVLNQQPSVTFTTAAPVAWYDCAWAYRKAIVIDHTKIACDLEHFPVLISFTDAHLRDHTQATGNDLLFTGADGLTKLPHEIERYTSAAGTLVAWVKVPELSSVRDTVLYLYYGHPAAADQQDAVNTWPAAFGAVWHLREDPGTTSQVRDSTANARHASASSFSAGAQVSGQIDGSLDFNGSSSYLKVNADVVGAGPVTFSFWMNPDSAGEGGFGRVIDNGKYFVMVDTQGRIQLSSNYSTQIASASGAWSAGTWYHVVVTRDASGVASIYVNGVLSGAANQNSGTPVAGSSTFLGDRSACDRVFDGRLDELRLAGVVRSLCWIQTEYNNQSSPGTFYSIHQELGCTPTTYSIGNRVWLDNGQGSGGVPNDGLQNGTEPGLAGVTVQLRNSSGGLVAAVATDANGFYRFDAVPAGTYYVQVAAANFTGGGALVGLTSSTGRTVGTDQRDNGLDNYPLEAAYGIRSGLITLAPGQPPLNEPDLGAGAGGHGPDGDAKDNLTIDFGFFAPCTAQVLVSAYYVNDVKAFDLSGAALAGPNTAGSGLNGPYGMTLGPDGHLYVTSSGQNGSPSPNTPNAILRFNLATGAYLGPFVPSGTGSLNDPRGVVWSPDGSVLNVNSLGNQKLKRYSDSGAFLGDNSGTLPTPNSYTLHQGSTIGPDGLLYVADQANKRILRYHPLTGAFVSVFATGLGSNARGLRFGPDGHLYVAFDVDARVSRYNGSTGAFLSHFVPSNSSAYGQFTGLGFGPDGHLYVCSVTKNKIFKFDGATGALMGDFATGISGPKDLAFVPTACVSGPLSVGNRVWLDSGVGSGAANDGVQNGNEPGVVGATVQLLGIAGNVVATTTTDVGGYYRFDALSAGTYRVRIPAANFAAGGPLAGYTSSTGSASGDQRDKGVDDASPAVHGISSALFTLGVAVLGETDLGLPGNNPPRGNGPGGDPSDNLTLDFGFVPPSGACVQGTFDFNGSTSTSGTPGNIRTFTVGGVSVKVSGFSRTKPGGVWETAYVGQYSGGLGVTDNGEGSGAGNTHTVDNVDRDNYLLFEFAEPVLVDRVYLGYVVTDSDLTAWIGTFNDPFNNHLTLNDPVLASFGFTEDNLASNSSTRWADLNAGQAVGNALVIAAWPSDATPDDWFKLRYLDFCKPQNNFSVGNRVWRDNGAGGGTANDGIRNGSEPGIANVTVQLLDSTGAVIRTTTTDASGYYRFDNLSAGSYRVRIPATNFQASNPLVGLSSSTGTLTGDQRDKGLDDPTPAANGIASASFTLGTGVQPTAEPDLGLPGTNPPRGNGPGGDANDNLTLDFGFVGPQPLDFGDLPDPSAGTGPGNYQTLLSDNGPRHALGTGLLLGSTVDAETDGQPNSTATGDDLAGSPDDEEGIAFNPLERGQTGATLTATVAGATAGNAWLQAWIDFNNDGDFADAGEQLALDVAVVNGPNVLTFNVPSTAVTGTPLGARFRLGTQTGLSPTGAALDGEVEDYLVTIAEPPTFSVGNRVWRDNGAGGATAGDGLQTGTEPGIAGVTVQLRNGSGAVIATTTTDAEGYYRFDAVPTGSGYTVFLPAADNFAAGKPLQGLLSSSGTQPGDSADKGVDQSDPTVSGISSLPFNLGPGLQPTSEPDLGLPGANPPRGHGPTGDADDNLTLDFGFVTAPPPTFSVGNRVWLDNGAGGGVANNGLQDGNEPGVSGVTVQLLDNGGSVIGTATTDGAGYYRFDNVPAGTGYKICLPASNFGTGGPLNGTVSSNGATAGTDKRDNGIDANPATDGICSDDFSLGTGLQPTGEPDVTGSGAGAHGPTGDANDDLTVDFGFFATPTLAVLGAIQTHAQNGETVVEWLTASEVGAVAFDLYRWDATAAAWHRVNSSPVAAANSFTGGLYRVADPAVALGQTATYLLVEFEDTGARRTYGPYPLTVTARPAKNLEAPRQIALAEATAQKRTRARVRLAAVQQAQTEAVTLDAYHHVQLVTQAKGLHFLRAATLAQLLRRPETDVRGWIAAGDLGLFLRDGQTTYVPAEGGFGLYFYAEQQKDNYTDQNVYWLTSTPNLPVRVDDGQAPTAVGGLAFLNTLTIEQDVQLATSLDLHPEDDHWMWARLVAGAGVFDSKRISFQLDDLALSTGLPGRLRLRLYGGSVSQHTLTATLNGHAAPPATWSGKRPYDLEVDLPLNALRQGKNELVLRATLAPGALGSQVYLDRFAVDYPRAYHAAHGQLECTVQDHEVLTVSGFATSFIGVFDVAVPRELRLVQNVNLEPASDGYRASFRAESPNRRYLALELQTATEVRDLRLVQLAGLADPAQKADYLIVAPPELVGAAADLAAYRQSQGLTPKIVSLDDIRNEFGFGALTPHAIRQFLATAHARWALKPRYVVLVGDGTYDYKDRQKQADNLVPPLMVATSAGLFPSDSALGDLDGDGRPELAVGRLPVMTAAELQTILAKMKVFEAQGWPANPQALLVADQADSGGQFLRDIELARGALGRRFQTKLLHPTQEVGLPAMRAAIQASLREGVDLLNYVGHGALDRLGSAGYLTREDVSRLTNGRRLPIVLAMTCLAGQYAVPGIDCLGEELLLKEQGGAIAVWAPTGLSQNGDANRLSMRLLQGLRGQGGECLGDLILEAKRGYAAEAGRATPVWVYNLLGDPALRLKGTEGSRAGGGPSRF